MERVTGIGGVFFRSRDPAALARWYADHLGAADPEGNRFELWEPGPGH
jgi:glyoxylase I family protein